MNDKLKHLLLVLIAITSLHAVAETEPHDTVYFYDSWQQMLYLEADAYVVDPYIEALTPYEVYVETGSENVNDMIRDKHIGVSLGDSIWLINSNYLKKEFKGDVSKLNGFIPVFFNEKVAYITYTGKMSLKDLFFGPTEEEAYNYSVDYYYIDFINKKVLKLTPGNLSALLEDYHNLQMRYEGMKDYKKREIIEDYFYKYVDRATQDVMRPYILDLAK